MDVPVLGTILYEEEDILKGGLNHHRKEHVSLVFQNYNLIDYLTPKENVMLGGNGNPEELLTAVGIQKEDWDRKVLQLSGGQQQRVAIARALASPAKVLLADEPSSRQKKTAPKKRSEQRKRAKENSERRKRQGKRSAPERKRGDSRKRNLVDEEFERVQESEYNNYGFD